MAIRRRETKAGVRYDVEWRMPDRSRRQKTFSNERAARQFAATLVTSTAAGEIVDPRGGKTELREVYRSWLASRPDLSAKVRRGYEDNWRLRIEPRFGRWQIGKVDHDSIQSWVNDMTTAGLGPRTVRWTHSVLKMTLDYAADAGRLIGRNPASRTKFPPMRPTTHIYLNAAEVAALANVCGDQGDVVLILAYTGLRFGELTGLNVEDVDLDARRVRVRRSMTQVGGRLVEGNPKSMAGRRSVPIPERLVPLFKARIAADRTVRRRSHRPEARAWALRTGSGRCAGAPRRRRLAVRSYASTICDTHTPRCHGAPVRTFASSKKRWATPPSPSPHTLTPTSLTTS
jgi:integrase